MQKFLIAIAFLCFASPVRAVVNVFACEPEWASLAAELGGDKVEVFSATTGRQDPHQIPARPALIARLRQADLLVCTGAELEAGWLPVLLRQGANPRVRPGNQGWFAAADHVVLKDKPTRLDRAEGDVHAAGNPHIQTDPRNLTEVAKALTQRLAQIDAANAAAYRQRGDEFQAKWHAAISRWEAAAAPLKGEGVIEYHKGWIYLLDWLGMRSMGTIEPKPGVPPSSGHLARLLADIASRGPRMIIYGAYQDSRPSRFVGEKSGLRAVELPFTVGGSDAAKDLFTLFDDTIAKLNLGARQ